MAEKVSQTITAFNLSIILALCLGSMTYGYAFSVTSTTLGQQSWFDYFDLTQDTAQKELYAYTNRIIGAMNACFGVGGFLGAIFIAWACDYFGRKTSLMIATPIAILGGALQGGAVNIAMFLVGRLLGGFSVGILIVLVPLFQSEIAPPASRGFLVSQHGVVVVFGYAVAAWIGVACYFSTNNAFQWRFPLSLQSLWPLVMLILSPFLPESPRWLLMKDRDDEAWQTVLKLHSSGTDDNSAAAIFAKEEYFQMKVQVHRDQSIAAEETVATLFTKSSYRKRMLCAFMTMFGTESTGILVIYNYSVLLYQGLGFGTTISLILAAIYVTVACCGNYINSLLIDRVGRKMLLIIGMTGCLISTCCLAAMTAQYTGTTNTAGLRAGVFFMFLFVGFYGGCLDATSYVFCAEIFPTHIRAKGLGFGISVLFLTVIAYLEAAPTAFAQVGWKYYLLFIVLTAINIPIIYFVFPETKGLSLEEIGEKFGDEVALYITGLTDEQRAELDERIVLEKAAGAASATHVERRGQNVASESSGKTEGSETAV